MQIRVNVPGLLRDSVGGRRCLTISGTTLNEVLKNLFDQYPLLRIHMYDEQGRLRQHVLIYYNSDNIAWLESLDMPLRPGDQVHVLQAVSGG
ncbi:MAG TPA: MoaD/ThiS family protein [Herpetosiphonaceae bacterium]